VGERSLTEGPDIPWSPPCPRSPFMPLSPFSPPTPFSPRGPEGPCKTHTHTQSAIRLYRMGQQLFLKAWELELCDVDGCPSTHQWLDDIGHTDPIQTFILTGAPLGPDMPAEPVAPLGP